MNHHIYLRILIFSAMLYSTVELESSCIHSGMSCNLPVSSHTEPASKSTNGNV
jgi:hypothetical protein